MFNTPKGKPDCPQCKGRGTMYDGDSGMGSFTPCYCVPKPKLLSEEQIDKLIKLFDDHAMEINNEAVHYERGEHGAYKASRSEAIRLRFEFVKLLEGMEK